MKNRILEQDIEKYCKALDIGYQVEFVREYSKIGDNYLYGGKHCGSDAEHAGSEAIAKELKKIGVPKVDLIPCETSRYQFNDASLKIAGEDRVIKPYGYVSPGTGKDLLKAQLIDIGKATREECEHADIEGKIVLFAAMGTLEGANLAGQMEEAVGNGAAAIIIYAVEDVLNEDTIRVQPPNIISPVPIVGICRRDADYLLKKLGSGGVEVELTVDAEFVPDGGTTYNVVGEIPGRYSDEKIIYTAHLDHYFRCLQDNISSCSTLLGIAKAMVDSGYRPNRSIVFAFHGSHETGGQDTRYPYIFGSYKLTQQKTEEWTGKAVVNINFEYTALRQSKFQMLAYMGSNITVSSYFDYAPELVGGFDKKVPDAPQGEYYMLSWSDSISYLTAGIPAIANDPITEQLYEGKGPYVGRDHSNHDDWDVFDEKALEDNSRMYGGLGIYIDSFPYVIMDFTEQTNRIRNEVDREFLEELGISTDKYLAGIDAFEREAVRVREYGAMQNGKYIEAVNSGLDDIEKRALFDEGRIFNEKMLAAYDAIAKGLDKINAEDFLCLATVKYAENVRRLEEAAELLRKDDGEKALDENLAAVDLYQSSYFFSRHIVDHMRDQICSPKYADRRTWAVGRELHVSTGYDVVETYKKEKVKGKGFGETIALIEDAAKQEISFIADAMKNERDVLEKARKELERI